YPDLPYDQVVNLLLSTVDVIPSLSTVVSTSGRLNLARAIGAIGAPGGGGAPGSFLQHYIAPASSLEGTVVTLSVGTETSSLVAVSRALAERPVLATVGETEAQSPTLQLSNLEAQIPVAVVDGVFAHETESAPGGVSPLTPLPEQPFETVPAV